MNIIIQWSVNHTASTSIYGIQEELSQAGVATYLNNDEGRMHLEFQTPEDQFRYVLISPLKNNFHRGDFREVRYED